MPKRPGARPLARNISSTRYVVVVLPLVPVTASSVSASAAPNRLAAMTPQRVPRARNGDHDTWKLAGVGVGVAESLRRPAPPRRAPPRPPRTSDHRPPSPGPRRRDRLARPTASRRAPRRSAAPRTPRSALRAPSTPRSKPPNVNGAAIAQSALRPNATRQTTPRGAGPGAGRCRSATPVARPSGSSNASSTPLLRAAWIACPRLIPGEVGDVDPFDRRFGRASPFGPGHLVPLFGQRRILAERVVVERQIGRRRVVARRLVGPRRPPFWRSCRSRGRLLRAALAVRPRRSAVGGDVQVAQRLLGDLLEDGRRHHAAQVPPLRLVDHDDDRQPRVLDRDHAEERRDPLGRIVVTVGHLLRRSGLAAHGVPVDGGLRAPFRPSRSRPA